MEILKMATIQIEPIQTQSREGYKVTITGIDPTDRDCIVGEITTSAIGTKRQKWNLNGAATNSPDSCNLNMYDNDDLIDLVELAKKLGAPN
jgi:hypothetical protein